MQALLRKNFKENVFLEVYELPVMQGNREEIRLPSSTKNIVRTCVHYLVRKKKQNGTSGLY